jgi:hypothetical protein
MAPPAGKAGRVPTTQIDLRPPVEETPRFRKEGPYTVDPRTRVVHGGAYDGELAGACDREKGVGLRIPSVTLTKDEASCIREGWELDKVDLYLDIRSKKEGRYCISYFNGAMMEEALENIGKANDCLGEGAIRRAASKIPGVPLTRGQRIYKAIESMAGKKEPGFFAKVWDGLGVGLGFALSAVPVNWLVGKITGKSLIDRLRNGRGGPKDPPAPPTGGGGGEGGTKEVKGKTPDPTPTTRGIPVDVGTAETLPHEVKKTALDPKTARNLGVSLALMSVWRTFAPADREMPEPKKVDSSSMVSVAAAVGIMALGALAATADAAVGACTGLFMVGKPSGSLTTRSSGDVI